MNMHSIAITACALGFASTISSAQVIDVRYEEFDHLSIAQLKSAYLDCERASVRGHLAHIGILQCSTVYEALKKRAFDGDFEKLLAWSRAQPNFERPRE